MAKNDFVILEQGIMTGRGGRLYNVAAGTAILAGEPVANKAVGDVAVGPMGTNLPVATPTIAVEGFFVGIANTNSTNTLTAAGTVLVTPVNSSIVYLGNPDTATSWDTQAEYDALVGKRVLIKNSTTVGATPQNVGSYTVLASDSGPNGVVVQAMNIAEHPAKVAISFRASTSNLQ